MSTVARVSVVPIERAQIDARAARRIILTQSKRADVGHIGSCLSITDILCALYGGVLRISAPEDPDRDRFILSKGHAGLALYAVLNLKGWIDDRQMDTFCGDNSFLGVHPESEVRGIDFSSGSLGQGPTFAVGCALAARLQGSTRRVYCLVSDAECNEGSVWEAVMFAAHHRLNNLTLIVDWNGQQALGLTSDVLDCGNLPERWEAFGWLPCVADGHSIPQLSREFQRLAECDDYRPRVLFARTKFGKGVSYMEQGVPITQTHLPVHKINWHYLPMSDIEYDIALSELETVD